MDEIYYLVNARIKKVHDLYSIMKLRDNAYEE